MTAISTLRRILIVFSAATALLAMTAHGARAAVNAPDIESPGWGSYVNDREPTFSLSAVYGVASSLTLYVNGSEFPSTWHQGASGNGEASITPASPLPVGRPSITVAQTVGGELSPQSLAVAPHVDVVPTVGFPIARGRWQMAAGRRTRSRRSGSPARSPVRRSTSPSTVPSRR